MGPLSWIMNITGLSKLWVYIGMIGAGVVLVATALFSARRAGRQAERTERAIVAGRIKHAQLKEAVAAPRGPSAVADSMRDGSF